MRCKRGGGNVKAFLHPKSPIPGPAINARVVDDKNGRYTISFPTTYLGECDLYIQVNGRDIRGSPFVVNFLPISKLCLPKLNDVRKLGEKKCYLNYPQQGGGPWGIVVDHNGHIFVADYTINIRSMFLISRGSTSNHLANEDLEMDSCTILLALL